MDAGFAVRRVDDMVGTSWIITNDESTTLSKVVGPAKKRRKEEGEEERGKQ